jgi:hypothetical protein
MIKEQIKIVCQNLLEKNLEINSILKNFPESDFEIFNEELEKFLQEKDLLIKAIKHLAENNKDDFAIAKKTYIKDNWEEICSLENENMDIIKEKKSYLASEISRVNLSSKAFSGYKINTEIAPRIIDEKE